MSSCHLVSSPSGVSENVEHWAPTAESSMEVIVTMGGIVVVLEVNGGGEGKGERGREEVHTWSFQTIHDNTLDLTSSLIALATLYTML